MWSQIILAISMVGVMNQSGRRSRRLSVLCLCAAWVALLGLGCSEEVTGPAPSLGDPVAGAPLPVAPGLICQIQHPQEGTPVVISGAGFSPLPFGIPGDPRVALPQVTLVRSLELDGAPGDRQEVIYGGEPGAQNAALLSWQSDRQMTLLVKDEVARKEGLGAVPLGLYDVRVTNPGDEAATSMGALGVVDRPRVEAVAPGVACLAQGSRSLTLTGQTVLRIGEDRAVLRIDGVDFPVDALEGCTPIAHQGLDAEFCQTARVTLPQDAVAVGFPDVLVQNPATAGCASVPEEDGVKLRVVPPPSLSAARPALACAAEGAREVVLQGSGLLVIDGATPTVSMQNSAGEAVALELSVPELTQSGEANCASLETQGHQVMDCREVLVVVPQENPEAPYRPRLTLTNPEPAGCSGSTEVDLVLVPDPTLAAVVPPAACTAQEERTFVLEGTGFLGVDAGDGQERLPLVTLDGDAYEVTALEGCQALEVVGAQVRWCSAAMVRVPAGALPVAPGMFHQPEVVLTNPDPAGCSVTQGALLTLAPPPVVESAEPSLLCNAQGERELRLSGSGFLSVDGALPALTVGGDAATITALEDCQALPVDGLEVMQCATATATVPLDAGSVEDATLVLTNPEPVGCAGANEAALTLVPPPSLLSAQPAVTCAAEGVRLVTLLGAGFLEVDGEIPAVSLDGSPLVVTEIGGTCQELTVQGRAVRSCDSLTLEIPQVEGQAEVSRPVFTVTNPAPAGCMGSVSEALTLVPPPSVAAVEPAVLCQGEEAQVVEITGAGFLFVEGGAPAVMIGAQAVPAQNVAPPAQGCQELAAAIQVCDRLVVELDGVAPGEGLVDVSVANPAPVGCSGTATGALRFSARRQVITSAEPSLLCTDDGDRALVIRGEGFLRIDGQVPVVTLDGTAVTVDGVEGCAGVEDPELTVESCDTLRVTVPQGTLMSGDTLVRVTSPAPLGCSAASDAVLTVPPALVLEQAQPSPICEATPGDIEVTVQGQGFLRIDGEDFTVQVRGQAVTPSAISGCQALEVQGRAVQSCSQFTVTLDTSLFEVGGAPITVTNPAPSGCAQTSEMILVIDPRPVVEAIIPERVCTGEALTLTLQGRQFAPDATVDIGGFAPDTTEVNPEGTSIVITFQGGLEPNTYDVTVSNGLDALGQSCEDTLEQALEVDPLPLVFFVDPPVVYNGIEVEATLFTANLREQAQVVELINSQGQRIPLTDFEAPVRPNRTLAVIPAGLEPDTYQVSVTSIIGCESALNGRLVVTDELTLALEGISPRYASPTVPTAVTLTTVDPLPNGQVAFTPAPRVYLNPNPAGEDATATALRAVVLEEGGAVLSAVIPAGLAPGQYDLVVVNPSGEVAVLTQEVTITEGEPPFVGSVAPGSLNANSLQPATVQGANFDDGVQVALECRDFDSGALVPSGSVAVDSATPTSLSLTVDANGVSAGSVCIVVVTNGDGASYRYSAVSVKEPSQNLNGWAAGSPMTEARRGMALEAGRPTDTSRFLYAVGGDNGSPSQAKASVESVGVDPFGQMGSWAPQRNHLGNAWLDGATTSAPRAFAGHARAGRFLYLTGGSDGEGATDTTLRAQILDPLATPEIVDVDAALGEGQGVGPGLWFYRVSALFPEDDPSNPGGESLPGEVLNVQLPLEAPELVFTLTWEATPGASGYRVYRSPQANAPIGQIQLLAEVMGGDTLTFVDDGSRAPTQPPAQEELPLPQGALGVWHQVSSLGTPRQAHATVVVPDLSQEGRWFLYALGGQNANGVLASGEVAVLTQAPHGGQVVGPWQPLSATLGQARAELGGFVVTRADTEAVLGLDSFLYLGPGQGSNGGVRAMEAGLVDPVTGDIASFTSVDGPTPTRVGYGPLEANGFLFMMGGSGRRASNGNDTSGEVVTPAPTIGGWDALGGGSMLMPRIFMGTAQESAFFFIAGGATSGTDADVTATVEQTIQ